MNYHTKITLFFGTSFFVSIVLFIIWKFSDFSVSFLNRYGFIFNSDIFWRNSWAFFLLSLSLSFSVFPFFFLREVVYDVWKKFFSLFFTLIILSIFLIPGNTNTFMFPVLDRAGFVMLYSILFLILSYIIIAVQAWKTRKK